MSQNEEKYVCSHCAKEYKYKRNLRTHGRSHTGTLPFTCCGKGFASIREFEGHRLVFHLSFLYTSFHHNFELYSYIENRGVYLTIEKFQRGVCCTSDNGMLLTATCDSNRKRYVMSLRSRRDYSSSRVTDFAENIRHLRELGRNVFEILP